jgi:hypothetical protein
VRRWRWTFWLVLVAFLGGVRQCRWHLAACGGSGGRWPTLVRRLPGCFSLGVCSRSTTRSTTRSTFYLVLPAPTLTACSPELRCLARTTLAFQPPQTTDLAGFESLVARHQHRTHEVGSCQERGRQPGPALGPWWLLVMAMPAVRSPGSRHPTGGSVKRSRGQATAVLLWFLQAVASS